MTTRTIFCFGLYYPYSTISFTSNDTTNPTGWSDIAQVKTGEKFSSLMNKLSLVVKNVRYLYKLLGTTSLSGIGDGTITNAISALNSSIKSKSFNISLVNNNYVSEVGITAKKFGVFYLIGVQFRLIYNIPAWDCVKIAQISNWDFTSSNMTVQCVSTMDANSYAQATNVQISTSGEVIIATHGALTAGDWFYGSTVF